jgi:hypothetical protein
MIEEGQRVAVPQNVRCDAVTHQAHADHADPLLFRHGRLPCSRCAHFTVPVRRVRVADSVERRHKPGSMARALAELVERGRRRRSRASRIVAMGSGEDGPAEASRPKPNDA